MQELTRRPLTDGNVELSLVVPGHQADQIASAVHGVLRLAEALNQEIVAIPKAKVGKTLKGFRLREKLTQEALALRLSQETGRTFQQREISLMETAQRTITEDVAEAFGKIFKTEPQCFLR